MNATSNHSIASDLVELRVASKTRETSDIVSFRLVDIAGGRLQGFEPGAHIDVHTGPGRVRQYSLCNPAPVVDHYEIAVLKDPATRGGSLFMHESLQEGATVITSRPKNHFQLLDRAPVLLFAGGIGITPILAMATRLAAEARSFELHYCARSRANMAFLKRLEQSAFSSFVRFHFDDEEPTQKLDMSDVLARASEEHHLYVCGPGGFIQHVLGAAVQAGWPERRLHREFFSAPQEKGAAKQEASFEIELVRSGRCIKVPEGQTALTALLAAGVTIEASCEAGVCGTCVTKVLGGTPDHRDVYLTDEEHARNDCFTPCCSRAISPRLVLDL